MRGVAIAEDRTLRTVELEPAPLRDHDVRVGVSFCGICGSDLHYLEMPHVAPAGTVMGHEFSGVVAEVGPAVDGLAVGDRVAVLPFEFCGACPPCRDGLEHLCVHRMETKIGGPHRHGAYAESVVVPASSAFRLPPQLSDRDAALCEPFAVGVHGVAVAETAPDAPVAVIGGGPIGVMTCLALLADGFTRIAAVELNERRRLRLAGFGIPTASVDEAADAVPRLLGGAAPAAVYDCTGHPSGVALGLELLPPRGRLVLIGYAVEPVPLDSFHVVRDEIQVRGAAMYTHADFERAVRLLGEGAVPGDDVVTAVRDLDEAQASAQDLMSGASDHLKVLLTP